MASSEYDGGTGGKFRKRPLRSAASTPYDRPQLATRGLHVPPPAAAGRGSRWLSNILDPASRLIASSATRLFSSVFRKRLTAPPGDNLNTNEDAPEVRPSPEVIDQDHNPFDARLSIHCVRSGIDEQESISGTDDIFELEQLVKQKRFSRTETDRLTELLHSRTIEVSDLPSTDYKKKGKLDEDSNVNPCSSEQAANHVEKEKANAPNLEYQRKQLVTSHANAISGVNISEEGFGSPIEIARAYLGSNPLKAAPSTLRLQQSQICSRDTGSQLSLPFGNKLSNAEDMSRSARRFPVLPTDPENDYMPPKPRGRSALYKFSRSPFFGSSTMTNPREHGPYKGSYIGPKRSIEWTPSSSNIRHSVHGQASKRGSSDNDVEFLDDVRKVRQKSSLEDFHSSSCAETSSTSSLVQGCKKDIDLKALENVDGRLPSASGLHVPPQSSQMARRILHQLDKLTPLRNKPSEKKISFGDASREGAKLIKGNYDSTKLANFPGRSSLGEPSSSTLVKILSSASPNKDKAKEIEGSPNPPISGALNTAVPPVSDAKLRMRSMDSNSHGYSLFSMQSESTLQSSLEEKYEPTKAVHAIFSSAKEPREKSLASSVESVHTSGLIHSVTDSKSTDASCKLPSAHISNNFSMPLLSSITEPTSSDGAALNEENTISPFKFGSTDSMANATKSVSMGNTASFQTGKTIIDGPTPELNTGVLATASSTHDKSVSSTLFPTTWTSASSSNPSTSFAAPRFQFGSQNTTIYSFTGLSAQSSSTGSGAGLFAESSSTGSGAPKFQFGSGNSTSYSFTGVAASSSQGLGVSNPVFPSLYPVAKGAGSSSTLSLLPISANGIFGAGTSATWDGSGLKFGNTISQNSAADFGATAASSSATLATSSGNGNAKFLDSFGAKPFSSSSCFSFSSGASPSLFSSSSLSPATFAGFQTSSFPSFSSPSLSAPSGSTLPSPSTRFSYGRSANPSAGISTSTTPAQPVFGLTTSATGFGSGSPSTDQMNAEDSRVDADFQEAQPNNLHATPGTQPFQFGTFQNNSSQNSPFQESGPSGNVGVLAGGSFSLGSRGTEKSERKFFRARRDKRRK